MRARSPDSSGCEWTAWRREAAGGRRRISGDGDWLNARPHQNGGEQRGACYKHPTEGRGTTWKEWNERSRERAEQQANQRGGAQRVPLARGAWSRSPCRACAPVHLSLPPLRCSSTAVRSWSSATEWVGACAWSAVRPLSGQRGRCGDGAGRSLCRTAAATPIPSPRGCGASSQAMRTSQQSAATRCAHPHRHSPTLRFRCEHVFPLRLLLLSQTKDIPRRTIKW